MLHAAEIDLANSVTPNDINIVLDNAAWAICLPITWYLKPHQMQPILGIGQDMLFDIPFVADWHKTGEYRQSLTDHSNQHENT
jgi:hypothetical protein